MNFSHLTAAALSDLGRKRKANEDAILVLPEAGIFCVADGMGGAAGGELASRWTVDAVRSAFSAGGESAQKKARLHRALNEASRRIKAMADEQSIVGAGTTAVVLLFDDFQPDQAAILHAGDSRAYRFREGLMECLTADHSLAASAGLEHDGSLPSIFRGVITRAIGLDDTVELDEAVVQVKEGDCYLLCSDGLTKMLADGDIRNLVYATPPPDPARLAAALVDEANRVGGEDNISVIVVRVGTLPARRERPDLSDSATAADITETAEIILPAEEVPGSAPSAPTAGRPASDRPSDTADVVVGVTPRSGHGSATALSPSSGAAYGAPGGRQPIFARHPSALAPRGRRSVWQTLWWFALALIALAAAGYLARHALVRPPPAGPELEDVVPPPAPAPSPAAAGGFPDRMAGTDQAAMWRAEWNKAFDDADYPAAALAQYRDAIDALCAILKLPATRPAPAAASTAEPRAEEYCAGLFALQEHLRSQVGAFVENRAAEISLFGDTPAAALDTLRRFSGATDQPAGDPVRAFETLRHEINIVVQWLAEDPRRLIPLEEIRGGPPSLLPRIADQRDEFWAGVLTAIAACGPAAERRLPAGGEDPLLNNIAALQRAIVRSAQARRDRPDVPSWPGKDNLPTVEGFFQRVGQYMNREPAPAPAAAAESNSPESSQGAELSPAETLCR